MGQTLQLTKEDEQLLNGITENLTDLGSAKRFITQANGEIRFLWERGKWIYWTGKAWEEDQSGKEAAKRAELTVRSIYAEAAECEDKKDREALSDYARKSESEQKLRAMLKLAQPRLSVAMADMDPDPWLLNCLNGTINLQTGELLIHDRENLISNIIPVEFDIDAECPEWLNFLNLIMGGEKEMLTFLQRAIGYSLTGHTDERCLFILYGEGRNGKSTFTENIAYMLPGYAMKTPSETLLLKKWGDGIPSDIARLKGARFVYASETGQGRRLNESRIKELTGDKDTLVGRFLHREYFEFVPSFKLWLHTNHKPTIRGTDNAIWDRIKLIPFEVRIPDEMVKPRREVDNVLEAERPGILAWAVKGCLDWQREGLTTPEAVKRGTDEYREESDVLKEFLDECCTIGESNQIAKTELFEAYTQWGRNSGERFTLNKTKFGAALKQRGFDEYRETGGRRKSFWLGIGLIT
ncbi:MAG: phage/plasmid primase, P4 family [Bacillota bacterium]|nr:phage/plasmid primase, P4 family [Bacillota bacterium]